MSKQLEKTVAKLNSRISAQADEIIILKNEMSNFKKQVGQDMKRLLSLLQKK